MDFNYSWVIYVVSTKKAGICISFAVPRRGGVHQAPSLLPRRQVEGDGGAQDQATLQTQNCKLPFMSFNCN